jgi:hypothetical protein
MIINLLIPDELKKKYKSFDDCLDSDGFYNIQIINYTTLQRDDVKIPKQIVKRCDLSTNLFEIDESDLDLIQVTQYGTPEWVV